MSDELYKRTEAIAKFDLALMQNRYQIQLMAVLGNNMRYLQNQRHTSRMLDVKLRHSRLISALAVQQAQRGRVSDEQD